MPPNIYNAVRTSSSRVNLVPQTNLSKLLKGMFVEPISQWWKAGKATGTVLEAIRHQQR